jgi:hypothetical protein
MEAEKCWCKIYDVLRIALIATIVILCMVSVMQKSFADEVVIPDLPAELSFLPPLSSAGASYFNDRPYVTIVTDVNGLNYRLVLSHKELEVYEDDGFYRFTTKPPLEGNIPNDVMVFYYDSTNERWAFSGSNDNPVYGQEFMSSTGGYWRIPATEGVPASYSPVFTNYNIRYYQSQEVYHYAEKAIVFESPQDLYAVNHLDYFPDLMVWGQGYDETIYVTLEELNDDQETYRVVKMWTFNPKNESLYITQDQIPYSYKQMRFVARKFGLPLGVIVNEVYIKIEPKVEFEIEVLGVEDGKTYLTHPSVILRKYNSRLDVGLYINGELFYRSIKSTDVRNFQPDNIPYQVGVNLMELKNYKTGELYWYAEYEVMRPKIEQSDDVEEPPDDLTQAIGKAPTRDQYEDGILGAIEYGLDLVGYWVSYPFVLIGEGISSMVKGFEQGFEWVGEFAAMIGSWFLFLPPEIRALMIGVIVCAMITMVIKLFK